MSKNSIRVRFAPAPTGMMHLGNVRTALMNYLFARHKNGTFILRIEDTDSERNYDPQAKEIMADLAWLGIEHTEGPEKGGAHEPYFQSKRTHLYQDHLEKLIAKKGVYRCFCTEQELEKKRERQKALKQPPRYDRACLKLSQDEMNHKIENHVPFIWRVALNHEEPITINDLAHGSIEFDFKHFSDFPITRKNGTFTFMFANFVDDMTMEISHVFRGDDHLTNTAGQAALYRLFNKELPTFWHMPILCNKDGKKLSKRDFGFSLRDLKKVGFTPEAICNYLGIVGASFEQEVMSLSELAQTLNFDNPPSTGHIKYDVEKLKWLNHKWIEKYDTDQLAQACKPFLVAAFENAQTIDLNELGRIVSLIKTDLTTLKDAVASLHFYFEEPSITTIEIAEFVNPQQASIVAEIVNNHLNQTHDPDSFAQNTKESAKQQGLGLKPLFCFIRLALTGKPKGPSIQDLVAMLGEKASQERLQNGLELLGRIS